MPSRRRSPCGSNASNKNFRLAARLEPGQQVRLEQHLDPAALPLAAVDLQRHLRAAVDLQHHAGGQQNAKRHDDQQAEVRRAGHFADRDRHHRTALFVGLLLLHFADFGRLLARTAAAHRPVFELPLGELLLGRRSLPRRCPAAAQPVPAAPAVRGAAWPWGACCCGAGAGCSPCWANTAGAPRPTAVTSVMAASCRRALPIGSSSSVFGIAHDARLLARPCAPAK